MKSTAKAAEKRSRTVVVLAIAVALMLLGSIFAQMFNTSFYKVKVSRISFDTDSGTLSGLLYMPKGVDASNPHPTIVTTHGYLNSAEMQDETAIEMSRRGYVVLALDMYDHGHSHGNADNTGGFFNFWPTSLWDAAQYMYSQDYVAKDAQGNGQIAVSGHSMGGFSSEMAIYLDEQNYAAAGYRIIKAGLSMGADYSWTSYLGLDEEAAVATFGGRTIGKICGQYDEFFFAADEPPTKSGTVYHKDYVATTAGKTLLEQEAPQADTWYTGSDGGQRIIYQPREIHPWNHFSKASTKDAIEFYATAFADQSGLVQNIASTSQIWYWKEVFELVALVGFLLMLAPLALLLMKLPFLSNAKQAVAAPTPAVGTLSGKLGTISLFVVGMLIPAIIFPAVYDGSLTAEPIRWMRYASDVALLLSVVGIVLAARQHRGGPQDLAVRLGVRPDRFHRPACAGDQEHLRDQCHLAGPHRQQHRDLGSHLRLHLHRDHGLRLPVRRPQAEGHHAGTVRHCRKAGVCGRSLLRGTAGERDRLRLPVCRGCHLQDRLPHLDLRLQDL